MTSVDNSTRNLKMQRFKKKCNVFFKKKKELCLIAKLSKKKIDV